MRGGKFLEKLWMKCVVISTPFLGAKDQVSIVFSWPISKLISIIVTLNYHLGIENAKKVANLLSSIYPAMYKYDGSFDTAHLKGGYGLGGINGVKNLGRTIFQRVKLHSLIILNVNN